jgi:hypothetical protein
MHFVVTRINLGQVATPNPYYIVVSLLGSSESRMCRGSLLAVHDDLLVVDVAEAVGEEAALGELLFRDLLEIRGR